MTDYEKLGVFYLGRRWDGTARTEEPVLYPSRDLTTHAVCVGMTGSGKTGLAVGILEEAAIDGIPAIVIDPKGDLGNLLLTFPELRPGDFEPWIEAEEAGRKGLTVGAYAAEVAKTWRDGLADWGQDAARIARFRAAAEVTLYTPGSSAGVQLALLRTFRAPPPGTDEESLADRIGAAVGGLCGLLGIDADPLASRDYILLARLLHDAWIEGRDMDVAALVQGLRSPPFERVGLLDLESFYPEKERAQLVTRLNNLLASPVASSWAEGEGLDVARLLRTPEGRPRIAVISIAHLGDAQRMFFVATLLSEVLGWMRTQSGTSSLRALLFMDEIQGYFPPVANPPSKAPMLTLLKQARAFGLGVVLATQNPVDLDYKGLANCGTWFVGRLQTERDKARLLDGLEGTGADRAEIDRQLSSLGKRVFLLHDVRADRPILFQTRWTLSFLRGPLSRDQIRTLSGNKARSSAAPETAVAPRVLPSPYPGRPVLPAAVPEVFVGTGGPWEAVAFVVAKLHYVDAKRGVDHWEEVAYLATPEAGSLSWDGAKAVPVEDLSDIAGEGAFGELSQPLARVGAVAEWKKGFAAWAYRARPLSLQRCATTGTVSVPGEAATAFRSRADLAVREKRDAAVAALDAKMSPKLAKLAERSLAAEARVAREQAQASGARVQTAMSIGSTIFGALFGRKTLTVGNVNRAAGAVRSASRAAEQAGDVTAAMAQIEAIAQEREKLAAQVAVEVERIRATTDLALEEIAISPRKADIQVERAGIAWVGTR